MKAWLMDTWRAGNEIAIWLKTPEKDIRITRKFRSIIYLEKNVVAERFLKENNIPARLTSRLTYLRKWKQVYSVEVPDLSKYERFVSWIERETRHRLMLYNADIAPEQMFLYYYNLKPMCRVELCGKSIVMVSEDETVPLKTSVIDFKADRDIRSNNSARVLSITIDDQTIAGPEREALLEFTESFTIKDPDVIEMEYAFSRLPFLIRRMMLYNIYCPFHRWDFSPIRARGGKSFFSYGRVVYRDSAIRLHGRFLIDGSSHVGSECESEAIQELCQLSGTRFQQVSSRSFGAVFQSSLVREMVRRNYLVPYKEKPVDMPLSMHDLMKADRVGHTFDPRVGLHHDTAEIDFSSMYPWIIYNHNISIEAIRSDDAPVADVPGLPITVSLKQKGIVPVAILPFLKRRMLYKKNPSLMNRAKIQGLKWVLVTSYGYLRFREFKLGAASCHMAIGAYARETILRAMRIAESRGFSVVHGIIDSLYVKKKGVKEEEVKELCREIEFETGIPVSFEGKFKWIVFLSSVNDFSRPVPTRYYGVFQNGDIKVRGIELRQRGSPRIVKFFQQNAVSEMAKCNTLEEIVQIAPLLCRMLRKTVAMLPVLDSSWLASSVTLSKTDYRNNIAQKLALGRLKEKGVTVFPGMKVSYVFSKNGVVLPEDYTGKPDVERYKRLLVRSLYILIQPFGFTKKKIEEMMESERQTTVEEYAIKKDEALIFLSG